MCVSGEQWGGKGDKAALSTTRLPTTQVASSMLIHYTFRMYVQLARIHWHDTNLKGTTGVSLSTATAMLCCMKLPLSMAS